MKTGDFTWLSVQYRWFLVALAGVQAGCGSSAKAPDADSQSTSPGDSTNGAVDDTRSDDSSPAAGSPRSQLDAAAPASATYRDGGLASAAATDAAWARTADAATVLDAGPSDSPRDAGSASGIDAALHDQDAAPHPADAAPHPADGQADGQVDAASAQVVKVDSKDEWTASGFQVQAGKCYTITTKIDGQWLDLDVPADLSGWIDKSDLRFALFSPFRRVVQDDIGFYQFAACVDKKLDQCFPVGETSNVCPKSSGELDFFLNDAPGFESNNVGTATVTIQAK